MHSPQNVMADVEIFLRIRVQGCGKAMRMHSEYTAILKDGERKSGKCPHSEDCYEVQRSF